MKKRILLFPILLLVAAATWYWYEHTQTSEEALIAYGNLDVRNVNVAFRVGGRVDSLAVEEGDTVAPGQLLAELDAEPQRIALRAAEAQVAGAQAHLAKLQAGFRPEEFEQARASIAQAEAAAERARREHVRQRELAASGASTPQALDLAEAAASETAARVRQAEAQLALLKAGFRTEDIAAAEAELAGAEARVADVRRQLDDTRLTAPAVGTVQTRAVEPGSMVGVGQTIVNVALTEKVWARAYLSEPHLGKIAPGRPALIYTDSRPKEPYHGHIGFISPTAEFTPKNVETTELRSSLVYRFRVIIDDPDDALRQGMPVTVRFPEEP